MKPRNLAAFVLLLIPFWVVSAQEPSAPSPEPIYGYSVEQWIVLLPTMEPGGTISDDAFEDRSVRVLYKPRKPCLFVIKGNNGTGTISLNEMEPKPRPEYYSPIGFNSAQTFRFKDGVPPDKDGKVAFVVSGPANYTRISDGLMKNAALEKYGFDGGLYEGKEGVWLIHSPHYADEASAIAMGKQPRIAFRFTRLSDEEAAAALAASTTSSP